MVGRGADGAPGLRAEPREPPAARRADGVRRGRAAHRRRAPDDGDRRSSRPHDPAGRARRSRRRRALPRLPRARGGPEVRRPCALDRPRAPAVRARLLRLRVRHAPALDLGRRARATAPLRVRRPPRGEGAARARAVRPRVLPRRPLPLDPPPAAPRDAQPRDEAGWDDALRDHRRPAARTRSCGSAGPRTGRPRACRRSRPCGSSSRGRDGGRSTASRSTGPGSSEALFLCEKTDELRDGADLSDVVTPHRPR